MNALDDSLHTDRLTHSEAQPELPEDGRPVARKKPEVPPQRALYMKTQ